MEKAEAIKKIRQMSLPKETMEILEVLIPELKESEDEKIRKAIINSLDMPFPEGNLPGTDVTYKEAVAWLEKQKEQKPAEWDEYTKTNLDRALQIIKDAKGNLQGYQTDDGLYECDKAIECLEHFLYRGLEIEKSAEWSEKDEKMRNRIIDILNRTFSVYSALGTSSTRPSCPTYKDEIDWLKSLRPQGKIHYWTEEEIEPIISDYLTGKEHYGGMIARLRCLKPKSSWEPSEEELVALKRIGSILRDYGYGELAKTVFMIEGKLANLPVLNKSIWKPSEEQMDRLSSIIAALRKDYCDDMADFLASIYHNLKKLM